MSVLELTPEVRQHLGLPSKLKGVVIARIDPNCPTDGAGLQDGDVIEEINRQPVRNLADFNRLADRLNGQTLLRITHQGTSLFIAVSDDAGNH